jgi:hypothetical protein
MNRLFWSCIRIDAEMKNKLKQAIFQVDAL